MVHGKKCDICSNDFDTGVKIKVKECRKRLIFGKWVSYPYNEKLLVCTKCCDTFRGLLRNYRRDRI